MRHFKNTASEDENQAPQLSFRQTINHLAALAKPEWPALTIGTVFLLVGGGMGLLYPQAIRVLIDGALEGGEAAVNRATLAMLAIFAVQSVAVGVRYYLFTTAGERIVTRLRERLFGRVIEQEIAFFDQRRTGELMSRLASDATVIQNTLSVNISMVLRNLLVAVGGLCLVLITSGSLTLVMLATVPPIAVGAVFVGKRIGKLSRKAQDALAAASETAEETIGGIRTVRAFSREAHETRRYGKKVWHSFTIARRRIFVVALFVGAMTLTGFSAVAVVLWFGGRMVLESELTVGQLTAFTIYTLLVAMALSALADLWSDFMRAKGASERIFEILDRQPAMENTSGKTLDAVNGRVEMQDVRFAYPSRPDIEVLRGVNLKLNPGEVVALVGPSGSGKSTIASLILRLYDPLCGAIRIDGEDLTDLNPSWLRTQVGVVAQEPLLFSTSIEENIRYGSADAGFDDVVEAAQAANAHDFIRELPDQYETEVGERGIQLSGGQKQRVAIARALLKDPPVLILDEATSALDAESEFLVQGALKRLMEERTSLVIAHRLSTVKDADQVLVIENGMVVQSGTHANLLEQGGVYRRLVQRQFVGG